MNNLKTLPTTNNFQLRYYNDIIASFSDMGIYFFMNEYPKTKSESIFKLKVHLGIGDEDLYDSNLVTLALNLNNLTKYLFNLEGRLVDPILSETKSKLLFIYSFEANTKEEIARLRKITSRVMTYQNRKINGDDLL